MRNRKRARGKGLEQHGKIECAAVLNVLAACLHIYFCRPRATRERTLQAAGGPRDEMSR